MDHVPRMPKAARAPCVTSNMLRLCQSGILDAVKIPGGPSGEEWYVAPSSVLKAIGDLKQIDVQRARRGASQPAASDHVADESERQNEADIASYGVPQHAVRQRGDI